VNRVALVHLEEQNHKLFAVLALPVDTITIPLKPHASLAPLGLSNLFRVKHSVSHVQLVVSLSMTALWCVKIVL